MFLSTWLCIHDKENFFDHSVKNRFVVCESAPQLNKSDAFLARFAKLDLTTPFRLQDLGSRDTASRIGI
jgi:hypothetical protein